MCRVCGTVAACCSVLQRVPLDQGERCVASSCWHAVACVVWEELLQRIAVCYGVLQRVAACCGVLQRVAACCSVLQRVVVCCTVLQHVAACFSCLRWAVRGITLLRICGRNRVFNTVAACDSMLQRVTACCSVLQFVAVCCSVLQRGAVCSFLCRWAVRDITFFWICCRNRVCGTVAACCSVLQRSEAYFSRWSWAVHGIRVSLWRICCRYRVYGTVVVCCGVLRKKVLQRVAARCSVLLLAKVSCVWHPLLWHVSCVWHSCSVLQRVAARCSVLQRVASWCDVLQYASLDQSELYVTSLCGRYGVPGTFVVWCTVLRRVEKENVAKCCSVCVALDQSELNAALPCWESVAGIVRVVLLQCVAVSCSCKAFFSTKVSYVWHHVAENLWQMTCVWHIILLRIDGRSFSRFV